MRKVWFFGDSSTFCHGLRPGFEYYDMFPERKTKLWTEHLCEYFNAEEINFGLCGASSEDIKFRLSTNLYKIDNDDVVVIQSTHPTRMNVFDTHSNFKPVHFVVNNETINEDDFSKEQIKSLEEYSKHFLVDHVNKYEIRDWVYFLAIKKELELRGVRVIYIHHSLFYSEIKHFFDWKDILNESGGKINDNYHLGWSAQKKFAKFILKNYTSGNSEIIPSLEINDHDDVSKIHFKETHGANILSHLYEFIKDEDVTKHYDESHIFI